MGGDICHYTIIQHFFKFVKPKFLVFDKFWCQGIIFILTNFAKSLTSNVRGGAKNLLFRRKFNKINY